LFSSHVNNLSKAILALVLIATSCLAQQLSREDQAALAKIDRVVEQQMLAIKSRLFRLPFSAKERSFT
jgi:hypothetical protein